MTDVALKDYLERLILEADRRYTQRFESNDAAIQKAEQSMTARLHAMNEFRDALKDQANRMATRDELGKVEDLVRDLQRAKANLEGRLMGLSLLLSGVTSLIIGLLMRWLR